MITKEEALSYHAEGRNGKIEIHPTKPCETQRDLSLAYTPGVAEPCREIEKNPLDSFKYTNRGNLVAIITNGTAVLGLGDIGPVAAKPVMEGKSVLFKKFAGIDAFDLELDAASPDRFIQAVQALEPTFGGINLEDIKAPDCFAIEEKLISSMNIPVFHDDQHGTAIIATAALINALDLINKNIKNIQVVFSGAGAAAIACAKMFCSMGMEKEQITLCDRKGIVHSEREEIERYRRQFAHPTSKRTLAEAFEGADLFIGVSSKGLVTPEMLRSMAAKPIVFALANPDPEINYEEAVAVRQDLIMATGRSDYPNQVNNVLGFPFIFRGALDVGATRITMEMKIAASKALAALAREPVPSEVRKIYANISLEFGPQYIIPKPFDRRVLLWEVPAVAKAAMQSGVATRPIQDWEDYERRLTRYFPASATAGETRSGLLGIRSSRT
ncbi:MAG: malate dehydrogenase [Deltaproteobacteria bacterium]|nr:malate dehydrogenase [Deltaproteobacteria bacterium]